MAIYPTPGWNQPLPEWLSLQQAAALYGVSVDTLRRRIAAGRLPASRFGERLVRVRSEDLDRLSRPIAHAGGRDLALMPRVGRQWSVGPFVWWSRTELYGHGSPCAFAGVVGPGGTSSPRHCVHSRSATRTRPWR